MTEVLASQWQIIVHYVYNTSSFVSGKDICL